MTADTQGTLSVYVLQANEDWITDVHAQDFKRTTSLRVAERPDDADIVWLHASWCWTHIDPSLLSRKTVVCTVHHIVPEKFDPHSFAARDSFVDVYFVYTSETAAFIRRHSSRPIIRIAHWIDTDKWYPVEKQAARERIRLESQRVVVGSFQRDTEGRDLVSPKLEKGPDVLCDVVERLAAREPVTLLLGGWRREYIINRMSSNSRVSVIHMRLPTQDVVRDMYASLDFYLCTSRVEGGPMCVLEAAIMRVPILSTPVGIASDILHPSQIISPSRWDFSLPTGDAIEYSHQRAARRRLTDAIKSYDGVFRHIHPMFVS